MSTFVYLAGSKLKTVIAGDGIEKWCEVCHFVEVTPPDSPASITKLLSFKVVLHVTVNVKRVVVLVRTRGTDYAIVYDSPVKSGREYSALLNAEAAIAGYIEGIAAK